MQPWDRKFNDLRNRLMESKNCFFFQCVSCLVLNGGDLLGKKRVQKHTTFTFYSIQTIWVDWQRDQVDSTEERTDFYGVCPGKRGKLPTLGTPELRQHDQLKPMSRHAAVCDRFIGDETLFGCRYPINILMNSWKNRVFFTRLRAVFQQDEAINDGFYAFHLVSFFF